MDDHFAELLDYLRARLDSEEAEADAVLFPPPGHYDKSAHADTVREWARHRMASIEAIRWVLEMEHEFGMDSDLQGAEQVWQIAVCRLAQQYEGREDWRTEWTR